MNHRNLSPESCGELRMFAYEFEKCGRERVSLSLFGSADPDHWDFQIHIQKDSDGLKYTAVLHTENGYPQVCPLVHASYEIQAKALAFFREERAKQESQRIRRDVWVTTLGEVMGYIRQETLSGVSHYECPFAVRNVRNNIPMPRLVFHRILGGNGISQYNVLSGGKILAALYEESKRIINKTSSMTLVEVDHFWTFKVDIDILEGDIQAAKQDLARMERAWE